MAEEEKGKPQSSQLPKSDDPVVNTIRALKDVERRLRVAVQNGDVKEAMLAIEELEGSNVRVTFEVVKPDSQSSAQREQWSPSIR